MQEAAATSLEDMKAREAVPEFLIILEDPDSLIHKSVISSLEKIGTSEAVAGLSRAFNNSDAMVRKAAAKSLEKIKKSGLPLEKAKNIEISGFNISE